MATAKDAVGRYGERVAVAYLTARGMRVIDRNWRCSAGEVDAILRDGEVIVFAEVKTRRAGRWSDPFEQLHPAKQRRVRGAARAWLASRDRATIGSAPELRFDAIGVTIDARGQLLALEHLEGAF